MAILTARPVTEAELRTFTAEAGGEWREDYGVRQGIIDRNGGTVLLTLEDEMLTNGDEEERAEHRVMLGSDPQSYIVIGVIWKVGSRASTELAHDLAVEMVGRWSGVIDWGELRDAR
jgi:hypothetical protein